MSPERTSEPGVVFDIVFEDGLLFFELSNRASVPVTKVVTAFRRPVLAPDGLTDLGSLTLFKKTEYLPPGKAIRVFVDTVASYFARRQPNFVHVALTWKQRGKTLSTQISHDIRIYRDLPYVVGRGESVRRGASLANQINQPRR
ncbi:MAG: hypothetical protein U9N79_05570 [Actinomycetota bacterium]|nr:hypothetical protein [Actinomycetota bacterium]